MHSYSYSSYPVDAHPQMSCIEQVGWTIMTYSCQMIGYTFVTAVRVIKLVGTLLIITPIRIALVSSLYRAHPRAIAKQLVRELATIAYRILLVTSGVLGILCPPLASFIEQYLDRGYEAVNRGIALDPPADITQLHHYQEPLLENAMSSSTRAFFETPWQGAIARIKEQKKEIPTPFQSTFIAFFQVMILEAVRTYPPETVFRTLTAWSSTSRDTTNVIDKLTPLYNNLNPQYAQLITWLQDTCLFQVDKETFKEPSSSLPIAYEEGALLEELECFFNSMSRQEQQLIIQPITNAFRE